MKKNERTVYFYDLTTNAFSSKVPGAKPLSLRRAFEVMSKVKISERNFVRNGAKEEFYVSDWKMEGALVYILVNRSDQNVSDPIFSTPQQRKRREIAKENAEGQDYSSHIVIKLPIKDDEPALALVENCTGITSQTLRRLFRAIIKKAKPLSPADFQQPHPDGAMDEKGKPKMFSVSHNFEFLGHLSSDLQKDLDAGKLLGVELITERERQTEFDDDGFFVESNKIVALRLAEDNKIKDKLQSLKGLLKKNENDWEKARIRFKTASGAQRAVSWDKVEGFDKSYVKREHLKKFAASLKSSYEKFNPEMLAKMTALL